MYEEYVGRNPRYIVYTRLLPRKYSKLMWYIRRKSSTHGVLPENPIGPFLGLWVLRVLGLAYCVMRERGNCLSPLVK